jgi:hypothetical protein
MGTASQAHSIAKAKQDRKDIPQYPPQKKDELKEARAHLLYYKSLADALGPAIKMLQKDLALCQENGKLWQSRIDKLEGKA